jgi:hypothetical protein
MSRMQTIIPNIRSVVDRDGALILDITHDRILTLNPTAGFIWDKLEKGHAVSRIVQELAQGTSMDPALIASEVEAFIEQLREKLLLVREPGSSSQWS